MTGRWAGAALLAATLIVAVPGTADASRRHGRDRCREDCRRSDDHDNDGRMYCIMPCVIIVPVPGAQEPQAAPAALFPPNPQKLTELIQGFAAGVGKSAGDLAGAIAAFPPALLL